MIITFCGHGDIAYDNTLLKEWLEKTIPTYIENGAYTFYIGGYGGFDILVASVLKNLQAIYPQIKIILVLAYLNQKHEKRFYDSTIYPELEEVPKHFAILRRNKFMVNEADIVIAYVKHSWGGAHKTLEYAKRKKKQIMNFFNETS